jgi:hypothetical protein
MSGLFVKFEKIEEWCKEQRKLGYSSVNLRDIKSVMMYDILGIDKCANCRAEIRITECNKQQELNLCMDCE